VPTLQESLQGARKAYESSDTALCRQFLDQAAEIDSDSLGVLRWRARLSHREGDWRDLYDATSQYCLVDSDDREMRQFLARACSNLKLWPEAVRAWRDLIVLRPGWPEGLFQLARAQAKCNLISAAGATITELEALGENNAASWMLAGRLAVEVGDIARAISIFSRVAQHDGDKAQSELGYFEKARDFRGTLAVAVSLQACGPSPRWEQKAGEVVNELTKSAAIHQRDGNLVEAYNDFAALKIARNDELAAAGMTHILQALQSQVNRYIAQEDPRKAIHTYQMILRCVPGNERALAGIGRLLMTLQDWSAAAEAWEALLEKSPRDREALVQHARAVERAQDFAGAREAWAKVLAEAPSDREANDAVLKLPTRIVRAGRKAVEEQRYVDAARLFALVSEECPEYADARRRLEQVTRHLLKEMRAAYKDKKHAHVVSVGITAAELEPKHVDVNRLLARAAMATRSYPIAAQAWKRLMALSPETSSASALSLAKCYLRMGKVEEGRTLVATLLRDDPENEDLSALAAQFEAAVQRV